MEPDANILAILTLPVRVGEADGASRLRAAAGSGQSATNGGATSLGLGTGQAAKAACNGELNTTNIAVALYQDIRPTHKRLIGDEGGDA